MKPSHGAALVIEMGPGKGKGHGAMGSEDESDSTTDELELAMPAFRKALAGKDDRALAEALRSVVDIVGATSNCSDAED